MPPPGAEPFLAAILANPDDDLVRLVYADWLDETGDPAAAARAEYVRVQVELAGFGYESATPPRKRPDTWDTRDRRIDALIHRQNELWAAHGGAWRAELPPCPGATLHFGRGFAAWADVLHPGGLMRDGDRLFAAAPVTRLSFRDPPLEALLIPIGKAKWFDRVRRLSVVYRPEASPSGDEIARALADSPRSEGLRDLALPACEVSDTGAAAVAGAAFAGNLARLDLSRNGIGNYGASLLEAALNPDRLTALDLSENPILTEYRRRLEARFPGRVRFG